MSGKASAKSPETKKSLREVIREHWSDKLELGGSKSGYVACYAANQVLGTVWRGSKEDPDTKEIRDTAPFPGCPTSAPAMSSRPCWPPRWWRRTRRPWNASAGPR